MEVEHEACAAGELRVDVEVAVHLQRHLLADGQSKTVARGEVPDFKEGLEHVFVLLLGNVLASVRHQELNVRGPRFLNSKVMVPPAGVYSAALSSKCDSTCDTISLLMSTFILTAFTFRLTPDFTLLRIPSRSSAVKCSPAVGAATEPRTRAYSVW